MSETPDFEHFDQYMEKSVHELMSLGSDPAMAGFVSVMAVFPMLNLSLWVKLVSELRGEDVARQLADEMETVLAKEQLVAIAGIADRVGPIVAEGCELALEVYRAFLRDLKTG